MHSHRHWKRIAFLPCRMSEARLYSDALFRRHSLPRIPVVMARKMLIQKTQSSKFDATLGLPLSTGHAISPDRSPDHQMSPRDSYGRSVLSLATAPCQSSSSQTSSSKTCECWGIWQMDVHLGCGLTPGSNGAPRSRSPRTSVIQDLSIGERTHVRAHTHRYPCVYIYKCTYTRTVYVCSFI